MWFRGVNYAMRDWSDEKKLLYCLDLHKTLHFYYSLINKLVILALKRNWHLVIENPYSEDHYLIRYYPIKPKLIDRDRRRDGDYFQKPTAYWFINFEPKCNLLMEPLELVKARRVTSLAPNCKERSEIHPQYARRFIMQYIIDLDKTPNQTNS